MIVPHCMVRWVVINPAAGRSVQAVDRLSLSIIFGDDVRFDMFRDVRLIVPLLKRVLCNEFIEDKKKRQHNFCLFFLPC